MLNGLSGSRHSGVGGWGVLCAKLKLHKIAPNAQGIRQYDVMISGEVQSLALPLTLREVKQNHRHEVRFSTRCGELAASPRSEQRRGEYHPILIAKNIIAPCSKCAITNMAGSNNGKDLFL